MTSVFLALLFSLPAVAANLPFQDTAFGCLSQAQADRYVADFGIDVQSFGGMHLCHSKDIKKLFNDLFLIEKTQFDADGAHSFTRGFVASDDYYGWMKRETRGVARDFSPSTDTARNVDGYFTLFNDWATQSTLGRVGTMIHEARHTAGYRHTLCSRGPYADTYEMACDLSYGEGGSHSVEMEYYARVVLNGKNLHPAYKSMARLMALGRSNFVFNKTPLRQREGLLALSGQKKLVLVDGKNTFERETPNAAAGSLLKRTSFGASLVKGLHAVPVDVYNFSNYVESDDYSYYKLPSTTRPEGLGNVQSIEEIDIGRFRHFAILGNGGRVFSYQFISGDWLSSSENLPAAQAFVTRAPNGAHGLFVVSRDGTISPYDLERNAFSKPLAERWTKDTRAYAMMGGSLIRLTADGRVLHASTNAPVLAFGKYNITDLVNIPLYDTFEVAR